MVTEYWSRFYVPSAKRRFNLTDKDWESLKGLAAWREKIMYNWSNIEIKEIRMDTLSEIDMGTSYHAEADIFLGELAPEDVMAEAYYGLLDPSDQFMKSFTTVMKQVESKGTNTYRYECDIHFVEVGHFGLNIRLTPNHPDPKIRHAMGLVIWGEG
jgi:starch phosphorylase